MEENIFDRLINKNEFPMLFVGSGISKRYLNAFPSWINLLESFWNELGEQTDFYGQYNILKNDFIKDHPDLTEKEIEYNTNIRISSIINEKYEMLFNLGKIEIDGFSTRDAHELKIDPFKISIKNKFNDYVVIQEKLQEIERFKKALLKAQIIITTNYDTFIEDLYDSESSYGVKKYIGQSGFFEETEGYAEIYKIHGCVTKPRSIVITETDYSNFNDNSILISAKIISMLMHSPIIFLGYSLTDYNVRKYIKDFARSIEEKDITVLVDKLIVVEWVDGENDLIEEVIFDKELNCRFTYVKTNNYSLVYEYLQKINQGVAPSEIRKYKSLVRKIVVDTGRAGDLKSVLLTQGELEELEEIVSNGGIMDRNIVVAIGDSKIIFRTPNLLTYLEEYYKEESELTTEVALRFLANAHPKARYPYKKYLNIESIEKSKLHQYEKEKLKQRLESQGDLEKIISSISRTYKRDYTSLTDILSQDFTISRVYALVAYNIKNLNITEVYDFIKEEIKKIIETGEATVNSEFRKLLLIYDLYTN